MHTRARAIRDEVGVEVYLICQLDIDTVVGPTRLSFGWEKQANLT